MANASSKIYALLVGINDYSPAVGKLRGCLNDVDRIHDYLRDTFDPPALRIEVLKDSDATRGNIIDQFRTHLCKAGADDVVLFQYSGHGARWKSAEAFKAFYPDGKGEGLVCFDSRVSGEYDLADKELAVLLAEVAERNPHIAVVLDCCHSGSATREADDFTQLNARYTHEVFEERPLDSYLDGFYVALHKDGGSLMIPSSKHILLAACERTQKAWEGKDHRGVFSNTLLDVLDKSGNDITYADLFTRCRAAVRKYADNQTPQFETYRSFNAYSGFLGRHASYKARRYSVYFEKNDWKVDCGALHGLPSDPDKNVELALYPELERSRLAGHATTTQVGAQKSDLKLTDFEGDSSARYQAEITGLPVPPLAVSVEGDETGTRVLQDFLTTSADHSYGVSLFTDAEKGAYYTIHAEDDRFLLKYRETDQVIQGAEGYNEEASDYLFSVLKRVADWERALVLQNHATKMHKEWVDFKFFELLDKDDEHEYPGCEITLDILRENKGWKTIRGKLKATNRLVQPLHMALVHFSDDFGIQVVYNERVEPTDSYFTLTPFGHAEFRATLKEGEGEEAIHRLMLIVSTEKIDDFLLSQDPLKIGEIVNYRSREAQRGLESEKAMKGLDFGEPRKKLVHENEWFTKTLSLKLIRQLDRVSPKDTSVANRQITIKGHPSLEAAISLSAAKTGSRAVGAGPDFYLALERQGMELLNFAGTRGEDESILELTDIQNPEVLEDNPLEIELNVELKEDEYVLPLAFDGEHILLTGDPSKDDAGQTHISIDYIPDIPDYRKSLGKALKLYFFKTYLKRENVNRLCWVEYRDTGSVKRHRNGVADKVATAKNVLLLIHGIIGDTEGIAEGLRMATDENGISLDRKFDVVLTYDYENLGTPITKTALNLKKQLHDAGLHEHDDKRLTLLVHSMGGLVSRWFIEQEGGNKVVDHLVMCGTPNDGSPFGKIDSARKLTGALTTVAFNAFPGFVPFGGVLLYVLNRSKKVTPTLEQMNATSDFIEMLNASDDPGVRYTILAGDIRDYEEKSDGFIAKLTAKIGKSTLFDAIYRDAGHDIAVGLDSIQGVSDAREPAPTKQALGCHHLNYFASEAGLRALGAVDW